MKRSALNRSLEEERAEITSKKQHKVKAGSAHGQPLGVSRSSLTVLKKKVLTGH
jgi:hypothetical protein